MTPDTTNLLAEHFKAAEAHTIADVGCGGGGVAGRLIKLGFAVVGVDPSLIAIEAARRAVPDASFEVAGAEALPLGDHAVDGVLFHNSFHHIPAALMAQALREAARVVRPGGRVLVVEPVARGPLFEAMAPIEDETEVRAAAAAAIRTAIEAGPFKLVEEIDNERDERFTDVAQFLGYVLRVDPARAPAIEREREKVTALFESGAERVENGYLFRQPQKIYILSPHALG